MDTYKVTWVSHNIRQQALIQANLLDLNLITVERWTKL